MLNKLKIFLILIISLLITNQASAGKNLSELAKRVQPAVVVIGAYDESSKDPYKLGTGFFINKYGHFITNYHVLKGAHEARVLCYDGREFQIKSIIAEDKEHDLIQALVDLRNERFVDFIDLTRAKPDIAENVLVVGSPLGLEQTVSEGIVSGFRTFSNLGEFYQITAPISGGSSGGPVVNMQGQVIGVVTMQYTKGQNLNFAVPSEYVFQLKHKVDAKAFWKWAEKEVRNKKLDDLGQQLSRDRNQITAELDALRKQIEIKKKQLYRLKENERRNFERQRENLERSRENLELKKKQLYYEYEALMREDNQLESMRGHLDPREFNSRLYNLQVKWNNYERKRKTLQDEINSYNTRSSNQWPSNEWSSRDNSALQSEIDALERLYSEKARIFNAKVNEYNSLSNDNRIYSAAGNQEHNDTATAEIHLKSGHIIKVISWWEKDDMISYSVPGGSMSIYKSKIKEIIEYDN